MNEFVKITKEKVFLTFDIVVSIYKKIVIYIKYDYKLTSWRFLNRQRKYVVVIQRCFGLIRRITFIVVALCVGWIINFYGNLQFTQEILSGYLFTLGAMTGGTIAIIFAISTFLLQGTTNLYSSQFLEIYAHDWREKIVYFVVILITILFFGAGLFVGGDTVISIEIKSLLVYLSLFFVGIVFAFIDWQYKNVLQKLNPSEAIKFLEYEGVQFMKRMQYDAEKIAELLKVKNSDVNDGVALATSYNTFLQPFIQNLNRQLENLVEISMKLSDKQEIETTKRGLGAVHNILIGFLEARKNSSVAVFSSEAFFAIESDSQKFLNNNFERLNSVAEKFIKEGKNDSAVYIIKIYNSLANKSKEIDFVGGIGIDNPILTQIEGYLRDLIEYGQRLKNIEIVFQGVIVLGNIGSIAAMKGLQLIMQSTQENIYNIAQKYGLVENQLVIVDKCTMMQLQIIKSIFLSGKIDRHQPSQMLLNKIAEATFDIAIFIKLKHIKDDFTSRVSLSKGYDDMYLVIDEIISYYYELSNVSEKRRYRKDVVLFFGSIHTSLWRLARGLKDAESTLIDSIGRLIFHINECIVSLLNDEEFEGESGELLRNLSLNIYLPSWFTHYAKEFDGGSSSIDTLTDSIAKTGIIVIEKLDDEAIAIACVKSLYSITQACLKKNKSSSGYDEPRIFEKACYLGILALKNGWHNAFAEVVSSIHDFEPRYFSKFFTNIPKGVNPENHNIMGLPHKDQLSREIMNFRDGFYHKKNNSMNLMDRAEDRMYSLIERLDIDRFIYEVWSWFPEGSEIEEEVKLKIVRREFINTLKRRLKT